MFYFASWKLTGESDPDFSDDALEVFPSDGTYGTLVYQIGKYRKKLITRTVKCLKDHHLSIV